MKKYLIVVLTIMLAANGVEAKRKKEAFVKYKDNIYVAKYEVRNIDYAEFLAYLKRENKTSDYEAFKQDTNLRNLRVYYGSDKLNSSGELADLYNTHPAYNKYPVTNISLKAMKAFCTWATESYNTNPKRKYKKILYRLPTEKEWMEFSKPLPDHRLPWYGNFPYVINKNGNTCALTNIKMKDYVTGKINYVEDGGLMTTPVGQYKPNKLGIYDIIGNVAERTEEGYAKGGSWAHFLSECYIDLRQDIPGADERVGFRLVMEVLEN